MISFAIQIETTPEGHVSIRYTADGVNTNPVETSIALTIEQGLDSIAKAVQKQVNVALTDKPTPKDCEGMEWPGRN